ncbi:ABC transporter ATP-binding protein [Pseudohalocynthiibacter aestuariivivens]|uniref:Spermidine/putrescine import ATP-binding protein PotA n=1 Tax=Roseovarius pelagicus TaxID=2980108 RepID=A0ABY6DG55_9RHOB|nr:MULTISPECIES: ABC transporter ATP-binding protein [Rhodobacterales]QIE45310.1 ABC transporter ATP-binding protein [Pseudohalocynthiibacter aestuariivivens]UXX82775.1 ABC transporter ATP-binding protein [Roseovarius pelagicus]
MTSQPDGNLARNTAAHPETDQKIGRSILLNGVTKTYGNFRAVDSLDLSIPEGELVTLLGPSGSGKSTTLMMIAGFTTPDDGEIWVGDRQVTQLPAHRRGIGVVFQQYALFPHMTVAENVAFPLQMRGMGRSDCQDRVRRVLDLVELPQLADRYPTELSGGQQQRVAFARAIVFDPPVLLLDEPLGALDKKLRETLQLEIKLLHARLGLTMIYVTHDQGEALAISDRVAVMNHGKLEQIGKPDTLYEEPNSRFVADFIGDANFLRGVITERGERTAKLRLRDGATVDVLVGDTVSEGSEIEVMLRPERVGLVSDDISGASESANRIEGELTDVSYIGESSKLQIGIGDGMSLTARVQNQGRKVAEYRIGQKLAVSWDVNDGIVFPVADYDGGGT